MELTLKELNEFFKKPSSSKAEKKIQSLLKKRLTPVEIFKKIKNSFSIEELSRFLYNSGMEQALLKFSYSRLKNNKPVSWAFILKTLIKHSAFPDKKLNKLLFAHWLRKEKKPSVYLFACEQWGDASSEFQQMSQVFLQDMEDQNLSKEKELLEQLAFVQAQELILEEEEIISKLILLSPENKEYKQFEEELKIKKALLVIEKQKNRLQSKDNFIDHGLTADLDDLKEEWLNSIFATAKKDKSQVKNLALFLYFSSCPSKALELLGTHVNRVSDYWFYLDWCLETKQYTKGLELVNQLSLNINNEPVLLLPLIYIKAQILYALGQKASAVEYLQVISEFKPGYKSAEYLLSQWRKN